VIVIVAVIVAAPVIVDVHVNGNATVDVIASGDPKGFEPFSTTSTGAFPFTCTSNDHGRGHAHAHDHDHDHGFSM
jgi:hypothetical protein